MANDLHQPHDHLVKQAFGHQVVMQDFLKSRLPKETLQRIDMKRLRLTNKSFSTHKGTQRHGDLIYAATIDGQSGYLYISLEHQSQEEKYMPLRQLEYNVLLMRQHLDEGHSTVPLIINICLYNGKTPYKGPVTLAALFEDPEMGKKYLLEGNLLVDLRTDSEEKIKADNSAALAELALKQAARQDFSKWLDKYEHLFSELATPYNEVVYLYILSMDSDANLIQRIEKIKDPIQKELAMTAAQHLERRGLRRGRQEGMQKGMQEGRQEGMQEGRQEVARKLLHENMDVSFVARATGLDTETITKLQQDKA